MTAQSTLPFSESGAARRSDPSTSMQSAVEVDIRPQELLIINVLARNKHGLTVYEMMLTQEISAAKLKQSAVSTRMKRLIALQLVENVQVPNDEGGFSLLTRATDTGRKALVYRLWTPKEKA